MNFYTDVLLLGDDILYRGYENGSPVQYREKIRPTLFFVPRDQSKALSSRHSTVVMLTRNVSTALGQHAISCSSMRT